MTARIDHVAAAIQGFGQVGTTTEHQDVSYAFAGVGAVLLAAAGLLSTLWRSQVV